MSNAPVKYELDKEQMSTLDKAFVSMTMRDGWAKKFETINEKTSQLARTMFGLTPKCPEQMEGLKKLQEAKHWFEQAISNNEF